MYDSVSPVQISLGHGMTPACFFLPLQGKLKALLNLNFSKKFVGEHFQPTYDWHSARYAYVRVRVCLCAE
jgi:hypothetical protein